MSIGTETDNILIRNSVAIIPARRGSKRIPNKNTREFLGKPIILRTISQLKKMNIFDKIIVSTESIEIKELVESSGAFVPFLRPTELAADDTPTVTVIKHAIKALNLGDKTAVISVYPTSIFLNKDLIYKSISMLDYNPNSIMFPILRFPGPIERRLELNSATGELRLAEPETANLPSQYFKDFWYDISQFYCAEAKTWRNTSDLYTKSVGIDAKDLISIDINDFRDWAIAEKVFLKINEESR